MKRTFLRLRYPAVVLLALLLPVSAAHAQKVRRMAEVLVTTGYGGAALRWPTFDEFLTSYAVANRVELRAAPQLGTGTTQSLGLTAAGCCYLGYQRTAANLTAEFTTGAERRFAVRQSLIVIGIEPRFFIGKRFFVGPTGSLCAGTSRVTMAYVYPDGTESWGSDRRLLGQFSATTITVMGGAKAGMNFGPVLVQLKIDYMPNPNDKVGLGDLPGLGVNNQLPRHYDRFLAAAADNNSGYSLTDDAVRPDLGMVRVALEVGVRLNRAD